MVASAPSTIVYSFEVGLCSPLNELLCLSLLHTADVGIEDPMCPGELIAGAVAAQLQFQVVPASGAAPFLLEDDEGDPITYTIMPGALQGMHVSVNLDRYAACPDRNRAREHPRVNAGDLVNVIVITQGVLGNQAIRAQFCYRHVGTPPRTGFTGQEFCGERFQGTGIPYPGFLGGYPNFGRSCRDNGSPLLPILDQQPFQP